MQQVESPVDESIIAPIFKVGLQQRKTGNAVFVLDDQFAVEQRRLCRKGRDRFSDAREAMRPILLLSRQQTYRAVIEPRLDAVAVELDLVNPFRSVRKYAVQRGKTRRYEIRKSTAAPIGALRFGAASPRNRHRRFRCGFPSGRTLGRNAVTCF